MPIATYHDDIAQIDAQLKIKQFEPTRLRLTQMPPVIAPSTAALTKTFENDFKHIKVRQLAQTFAAEVYGVDFTKPVAPEVLAEIKKALADYAVLYFRHADLDDDRQVDFCGQFGDLDSAAPWISKTTGYRFKNIHIFDVANREADGSLVQWGSKRHHIGLVNMTFHCDLSYNPRRAGVGSLRPAVLPPPGKGAPTEFADTKTAYEDLPEEWKKFLDDNEFIGCNSLIHSRLATIPSDSPWMAGADPETENFGRHDLVQVHEASGRTNLYMGVHMHHLEWKTPRSKDFVPTPGQPFERVPFEEGWKIITWLRTFAEQPKYVATCEWLNENDLCLWDNTSCMHRTGAGEFHGKYVRDMRRATCHDMSSTRWGHNDPEQKMAYFPEVDRWMYPKIK